jgi:hypothetical protein
LGDKERGFGPKRSHGEVGKRDRKRQFSKGARNHLAVDLGLFFDRILFRHEKSTANQKDLWIVEKGEEIVLLSIRRETWLKK